MVNNYATNYSKFQKNAPGADMLNREYEIKRRQSLEKSSGGQATYNMLIY